MTAQRVNAAPVASMDSVSTRPAGLLVPITTPFDSETGEVSAIELRSNTRALLEAGVEGIVAAGSTGEAPLLSTDEYRHIIEWLRDVVPAERWLVAGAGRESTRAAVEACRVAADEGADAVLVRPPSYYTRAMTPTALVNHFWRVADESPIPVFLYNIPQYTHLSLSDALFGQLADHENIWGAKDSCGDLKNFAAYRDAVPNWTLFVGSGALFYAALEIGAAGAIAATGCFAARETHAIGSAFKAGNKRRAGAMQELVAPLHKEIVKALGVAGVKAAVDAVGLAGGPVRAPLLDLDDGRRAHVDGLLRQARLISS